MPPHGYQPPPRPRPSPRAEPFRPGPPRPGPPLADPGPAAAASARVEQLLLDAQRQIVSYVKAVTAEAAQIRAAADTYAAGLRSAAEFEAASTRADAEREAARVRAAAERERDEIIRAARREADDIRRREQFLLEQSEALRSAAEADLEVELAARREEAQRQEAERLAEAQEATRALVDGADKRAADADKRAAEALARAEKARRDAESDARKEIADARRKAELIVAQAKDDGKRVLAGLEADAGKRRAVLKRELDELTRQKTDIDAQLANLRQVFAVGAFLDLPAD